MRLGVNIDHVATIRNARGGVHPDPVKAAIIVEKCGADLVVVHLREDRRHIKELDISNIINNIKIPLQLEIAPNDFMFNFAIKNKITKVCIVPEKRKELTTEGGLDLNKNYKYLEKKIPMLLNNNIEVSLFLDPTKDNIKYCNNIGVNAIEFHTGNFANADFNNEKKYIDELEFVVNEAVFQGISARAGHGLTYEKIKKIIHINNLEELNIGHFIIGEAIFYGLEKVVTQMKKIISKGLQ
jgi:pyridoxine 5-phosphate synthase